MKSETTVAAPGRRLRVYARLGLWIALVSSLVWIAALVLAPLTIPYGTVVGLEGAANRVDYGDLWSQLPPAQSLIYTLGDLECHQRAERTIFLNGNEMPVCARDASLFFFLSVGLAVAAVIRPEVQLSLSFLRLLPSKLRGPMEKGWRPAAFSWLLGVLCLLPLAADGGLQLVTSYESTNVIRFVTGAPAGFFVGLLIGLMIQTIGSVPTPRQTTETKGQESGRM